jgi:hypothetical protein
VPSASLRSSPASPCTTRKYPSRYLVCGAKDGAFLSDGAGEGPHCCLQYHPKPLHRCRNSAPPAVATERNANFPIGFDMQVVSPDNPPMPSSRLKIWPTRLSWRRFERSVVAFCLLTILPIGLGRRRFRRISQAPSASRPSSGAGWSDRFGPPSASARRSGLSAAWLTRAAGNESARQRSEAPMWLKIEVDGK